MTGREAIAKLKSEGWEVVRVRGSHHMMKKGSKVVPVPAHGSKDLGFGLLRMIEKQTGARLR